MTPNKDNPASSLNSNDRSVPQLVLRRLAVFNKGREVYDESFHRGVNIIRGRNGSGKSTIADFIFFALGGDISKWKQAAEHCDSVTAELEVNNATITVRRFVTTSPRQPMQIFWGPYEQASKASLDGWQSYSFLRSGEKDSFSQVLFRILGLPETKSESGNITMHQILRLIYVDQLTSVESIMRDEKFDAALIRETVGDMMFGVYDDSLYSAEILLRDKERSLFAVKSELSSVQRVLSESEQEPNVDRLKHRIEETKEQLNKVIVALTTEPRLSRAKSAHAADDIGALRDAVLQGRISVEELLYQIDNQKLEIEDSTQFIASLESRMANVERASVTHDALIRMPVTHCPQCLCLVPPNENEEICVLCKEALPGSARRSLLMRMKQELSLQIKESRTLLAEKEEKLKQVERELPGAQSKLAIARSSFEHAAKDVKTERDHKIDELLVTKGTLESRIEYLHRQLKTLSIVGDLETRKRSLDLEVQHLRHSIEVKRSRQGSRSSVVQNHIDQWARKLLVKDLPLEREAFSTAERVTVDFTHNVFALDGQNRFSASSTIYLKNCVHFAIFFSSLELDFMRYPRFILCDNMEDKGMETARSQNFQRVIVELSRSMKVPHQIIFTTSMIDSTLNTNPPCVGAQYDENRKSLRFSDLPAESEAKSFDPSQEPAIGTAAATAKTGA